MKKIQRLGCLILLASLLSIFLPVYAADPPLPTPIGRVIWVKGTITAVMANEEKRILQKQSVVYLHDTLITDANSQAQLAFTDNTLLTLNQASTIKLDQYAFTGAKNSRGSVGKYVMSLVEGGFRTITGLIAKNNPSDYEVDTPVATIGVRGTEYVVTYNAKTGNLDLGYYHGTPCVKGQKGKTVCLNDKMRYASVSGQDAVAVPSNQRPDALSDDLLIIPAKISPFGSVNRGGPITSFCIQ